jgi:hypothetical protein
LSHRDYAIRWKNPGDEEYTHVPSLVYPSNYQRDNFYTNSEALVARGDHVRLQDIQIAYDIKHGSMQLLKNRQIQLYLYANNLGILWRANKHQIDPDIAAVNIPGSVIVLPQPRTIAAGIRIKL